VARQFRKVRGSIYTVSGMPGFRGVDVLRLASWNHDSRSLDCNKTRRYEKDRPLPADMDHVPDHGIGAVDNCRIRLSSRFVIK